MTKFASTYQHGIFSKLKHLQINLGNKGGMRFGAIARYGFVVAALGLYFSEWRVVTRNIPIYNLKYHNNIDYDFLREQDKMDAEAAAEAREKAAAKAARG